MHCGQCSSQATQEQYITKPMSAASSRTTVTALTCPSSLLNNIPLPPLHPFFFLPPPPSFPLIPTTIEGKSQRQVSRTNKTKQEPTSCGQCESIFQDTSMKWTACNLPSCASGCSCSWCGTPHCSGGCSCKSPRSEWAWVIGICKGCSGVGCVCMFKVQTQPWGNLDDCGQQFSLTRDMLLILFMLWTLKHKNWSCCFHRRRSGSVNISCIPLRWASRTGLVFWDTWWNWAIVNQKRAVVLSLLRRLKMSAVKWKKSLLIRVGRLDL